MGEKVNSPDNFAEPFFMRDVANDGVYMGVKFSNDIVCSEAVFRETLCRIADKIAERYVAQHYQEIAQHLKPEAIATLVAAEVAADIGKTLKEDVRTSVREVVVKEVYQRGLKRIW